MPSPHEEREVVKKLDEINHAVSELRSRLNELNQQKEVWFEKKEAVSSQIRELISRVKTNRSQRNALTDKVRQAKTERERLHAVIKGKAGTVKTLNEQKQGLLKKHDAPGNPAYIRDEIDRLEHYLETNVISFEKEKELMKKINALKKRFAESSENAALWAQIGGASRELSSLRRETEKAHRDVQQHAQESQKLHESVVLDSREIDRLREEEKGYYQKFMEFKKQFTEASAQLKERLQEMDRMHRQLDSFRAARRKSKEQKEADLIGGKVREIEAKIRRGEKLTTEDLLAFQTQKNN
ncbi:hypothetical protein J4453_00780 [Candidatus Woesearchaeota archaeon]|nr:hypothetical protein [Candidatus Woesearchaeota archaeon]